MNDEFKRELAALLNRYDIDGDIGMPDFIVANYLTNCLISLRRAKDAWTEWNDSEASDETEDSEEIEEEENHDHDA